MDMEQMAAMMSRMKEKPAAISGDEAAKYREAFKHIEDLKPGDKVRWKGKEYAVNTIPEEFDVVEVFRVGAPGTVGGSGEPGSPFECSVKDFTVLYRDRDGDIIEYAFDSRRFERVE